MRRAGFTIGSGSGTASSSIVDEWESPAHFQQFFSDPELQAFIGSIGAAPAPPEMIVAEAVASADQY